MAQHKPGGASKHADSTSARVPKSNLTFTHSVTVTHPPRCRLSNFCRKGTHLTFYTIFHHLPERSVSLVTRTRRQRRAEQLEVQSIIAEKRREERRQRRRRQQRRTTNDERRTTNDERRTTNDERRPTTTKRTLTRISNLAPLTAFKVPQNVPY